MINVPAAGTLQYNATQEGSMLKSINFRIDETVITRLRMIGDKNNRSIAYVVRGALDDYIERSYGDKLKTIEKLEKFAKAFEKKE